MSNTSATGGYLNPTTPALPGGLTLEQFIQTVIVGISGYTATAVRPQWQAAPPKMPDISVEWIAYGVTINATRGYAGVEPNDAGDATLNRQEELNIKLSFYGPNCMSNIAAFRDGFQVQQNLEAMRAANMGFTDCSQIIRCPELINERWFNRADMTLVLARCVVRTYQVLSFASAIGTIHTVINNDPVQVPWETPEAP